MCRFKGRNAVQIAGNSCSIAKICNDEAVHSSPKMHVHDIDQRLPRPLSAPSSVLNESRSSARQGENNGENAVYTQ